ncbi:MAG: shikimate dehydrogenase [Myxococcales bacterium]|nr:shikimate dehydrogenase [Myxococcales bacterium]USN51629.1 MAG: shikimate dehydrogenase [Myxococcales bacterium]
MIKSLVGLIGWPLSHSLSPAMHNAAFRYLGLEKWMYVPLPVSNSDQIKEALYGLRALGFFGANVTVPYKETVLPYMNRLSPSAKAIGALNTISIDSQGDLVGYNTDGDGFICDLHEQGIDVSSMNVLLLGAGGAARAVAHALLANGCTRLSIVNRTYSQADSLAQFLVSKFPQSHLAAGEFTKLTIERMLPADLVINATSVGLDSLSGAMPWDKSIKFSKNQIVYDLIYNPSQTEFLNKAQRDGAQVINGLGMLVQQGALAFKIWTGRDAPLQIMRDAALGALSIKK